MNIISIIIAIILFSIIVIFHELGHFWLAKANGIKVNEFCLGLGPTLFGVQRGETKYSIKMLPFGGACIMEGEDESSGDDRAFNNKSVWARISVVFAGPFFNFIMAFLFALIIICSVGYDSPKLAGVIEGYAAEEEEDEDEEESGGARLYESIYETGMRHDLPLDELSDRLGDDAPGFAWVGLYDPSEPVLQQLQEERKKLDSQIRSRSDLLKNLEASQRVDRILELYYGN